MERWNPPVELSKKEQLIMKRLNCVRALFGFLRTKRHVLFDDAFREKLEGTYRQTGAGDPPHPPAWLCMVLLLQGYVGASDAEAVEMAVMDRRWQLVLDCLDVEDAPFAQGALQAFRERMIENGMDKVLLERTVALVREGAVTTAEGQQLSKAVRVGSRPPRGGEIRADPADHPRPRLGRHGGDIVLGERVVDEAASAHAASCWLGGSHAAPSAWSARVAARRRDFSVPTRSPSAAAASSSLSPRRMAFSTTA